MKNKTHKTQKSLTALALSVIMALSGVVVTGAANIHDEHSDNTGLYRDDVGLYQDNAGFYQDDAGFYQDDIGHYQDNVGSYQDDIGLEIIWDDWDDLGEWNDLVEWNDLGEWNDWNDWEPPYTIRPWQPGDTHDMGDWYGHDYTYPIGGTHPTLEATNFSPGITRPNANSQVRLLEDLTVTWNSVSQTTAHRISLRNINTNQLVINRQLLGANTRSHTISRNQLVGGARFRVAVMAQVGGQEHWTEREFWVAAAGPNITNPSNNQNVPHQNLQASWQPAANATSYLVSLRNVTTGAIVIERVPQQGTSRTIQQNQLQPGHRFRLAVGSVVDGREGYWTYRYFNVAQSTTPNPPNPPTQPNQPTLALSISSWNPAATGDTGTFTITTNQPIENVQRAVDVNWITVTASGTTRTMHALQNTSASPRSGTIRVSVAGQDRFIHVTQAAAATLTVYPYLWSPTANASSQNFTITTNQPIANVHASSDVNWLNVSGTGSTRTMTVAQNTSTSQRSGMITISVAGQNRFIRVTQAAAAATLTVSPTAWTPAANASSQSFTISTNQPIATVHASSNVNWLSVSGTGATRTMTVSQNTFASPRSGTITVSVAGQSRVINVTQAAAATVAINWNSNGGNNNIPAWSRVPQTQMGTLPSPGTRAGFGFIGWSWSQHPTANAHYLDGAQTLGFDDAQATGHYSSFEYAQVAGFYPSFDDALATGLYPNLDEVYNPYHYGNYYSYSLSPDYDDPGHGVPIISPQSQVPGQSSTAHGHWAPIARQFEILGVSGSNISPGSLVLRWIPAGANLTFVVRMFDSNNNTIHTSPILTAGTHTINIPEHLINSQVRIELTTIYTLSSGVYRTASFSPSLFTVVPDPFFAFYGDLGWEFPLRHAESRFISSGFMLPERPDHEGIDIQRHNPGSNPPGSIWGGILGEPVYSAHSGTVLIATWSSTAGYWVAIRSGVWDASSTANVRYIVSRYLHLQSHPIVSSGDGMNRIAQGVRIGYVGNTGAVNSSGHLHLDINNGNQFTSSSAVRPHAINPERFFPGINFLGRTAPR